MIFCPKCHNPVIDNAKFCHHCGANVDVPMVECIHCGKKNPLDAKFCYHCHLPARMLELSPITKSKSRYLLNFEDVVALEGQIKNLFFETLKNLSGWMLPKNVEAYLQNMVTSGFMETVDTRSKQLALDCELRFMNEGKPAREKLEKEIQNGIYFLALYFIVYNCKDLNPVQLSEKIFQYERINFTKKSIKDIILDFLDLDKEKEKIYFDAFNIPEDKLIGAYKQFLFTAKDEYPIFICDQSWLGNSKEGFAMTPFALYWRSAMHPPQKIYYHHLTHLVREKSWITINKHFFNVNPNINIKMLILLERLKNLYVYE